MLLILEPVGQREARGEAEGRIVYERMLRFADDLKTRGLLQGAESLASHRVATRVRQGASTGGASQVYDVQSTEAP
ncbi:hypothetical protein ACQV5M_20345, partial [Leptospira sp. SA-E8]|uniref:hypothetical protein n=1 Tax=Leptospira sp. SA-E8 TaxID=3422259 RepID=UPI003EBD0135